MADYGRDRDYGPTKEEKHATEMLPLGYVPLYITTVWPTKALVGYKCLLGCGCMVWDTDAHRKNMCRDDR